MSNNIAGIVGLLADFTSTTVGAVFPSDSLSPSTDQDHDSGLSAGAVYAIVMGGILVAGMLAFLGYLLWHNRNDATVMQPLLPSSNSHNDSQAQRGSLTQQPK